MTLVREGDPDWRKSWFYYYNYEKKFPYTPNVRGVRTDEWKYMHYPHGDGPPDRHLAELYDLKQDPGENVNLFGATESARRSQRLQAELTRDGRHRAHAADRQDADRRGDQEGAAGAEHSLATALGSGLGSGKPSDHSLQPSSSFEA